MQIHVLGSAAGGGVPQWNCGCPTCRGARDGSLPVRRRTQASVAVSADGEAWFLIGASPEIRAQIESVPPLHPHTPRRSPLAAVLLCNGDLDHCLGLLSLRESHPIHVHATERVRRGFTEGNALYRTLERFPGQVTWHPLAAGVEAPLLGPEGRPSGLSVRAVGAPGKAPIHLEGRAPPSIEDNVGLVIREAARGRTLAYFPSVAAPTLAVAAALAEADVIFFDGTFWSDDELPRLGLSDRRAAEMAHWSLSGPEGSLAMLARIPAARRVLIHINNTNPILDDGSPERAAVAAAGVEVAFDGMEVTL
jgi:pyrroloquinoline quinone biosynthesis protein B